MFKSISINFNRAIGTIVKALSINNISKSTLTTSYNKIAKQNELILSVLEEVRKRIDKHFSMSSDPKAQSFGADAFKIINVSQYIMIANYDLLTLNNTTIEPNNPWGLRLHARYLLLIVYEILDDLPQMLGSKFKKSVSRTSPNSDLLEEIDKCSNEFTLILHKYEEQLKGVRDNIAAHRDHIASLQLDWIKKIDIGLINELTRDVSDAFAKTFNVLDRLHNDIVTRMDSYLDEE